MSSNLPSRVRDLFHAAIAKPADQRQFFLRQACGDDFALFDEVWQLIDLYHQIEAQGEETVREPGSKANGDAFLGRRVGAYEIVRLVGAGGMGRVYLARRADGAFDRDVAVKVIKPEAVNAELITRFEQEQRLLASLRHPCIAALIDAGRAESGELYFVMEFIDGVPITEYCHRHDLSLRDRLALLVRVGEAVAEAHQQLIVHRDLKPKNILVDSTGCPKLVDFGIAKAITPAGLEASDPTQPLQKRVTRAYASPEQMRGQAAQTGMDVFSLGVVLHELVTGFRPATVQADDTTAEGAAGVVKPSDALARANDPSRGPGAKSGADEAIVPAGVRASDLQGDLDAILLKAVHANPRQRYRSVESLLADLRAYLQSLPISAREWPLTERVSHFVRRNRTLVAVSSVAVIALLVSVVSLARLWLVASRDRDRATVQVANQRELAASAFNVESQLATLTGATEPRRELVAAIGKYLSNVEFHGNPAVTLATAEGYRRLGDVLGNPNVANLGEPVRAVESYRTALSMLEPLDRTGSDGAAVVTALVRTRTSLGDVLASQQQRDEAKHEYEAALTMAEQLSSAAADPVAPRVLLASVHRPLGDVLLAGGDAGAALVHFEKALAIDSDHAKRFPGDPEHRRLLALTQFRIAAAHAAEGKLAAARLGYERSAALLGELAKSGYGRAALQRDVAVARVRLGVLLEADRDRSGRQEIRQATADLRSLAEADPADARLRHDLVAALVQLADVLRRDDAAAARNVYQEAREIALPLGAGQPANAGASRDLALIDRRIADAAAGDAAADLRLFKTINGRRLLLQPGDVPPAAHTPITVEATAAAGWSRYLLLFGASGPAQLLADDDLAQTGWTMPVSGPPPAQTILLLAFPRRLSDGERQDLVRDVNAIEGPRVVDPDAQIVWTLRDETIESNVVSRGAGDRAGRWVRAVRERIAKFGQVALSGRTFPLASAGRVEGRTLRFGQRPD